MKYILDHYYFYNHIENCLIIESDKSVEDLIEITASIEFLFADMDNGKYLHEGLDQQCLLKILKKYYGVKDIKANYSKKELEVIGKEMPFEFRVYKYKDFKNDNICFLDLYGARESQANPNYKKIMDKWLPKGQDLENLKDLLRKEGVEK